MVEELGVSFIVAAVVAKHDPTGPRGREDAEGKKLVVEVGLDLALVDDLCQGRPDVGLQVLDVGEGIAKGVVEKVVTRVELDTGGSSMLTITTHNDVGVVSFRTSRILDQSNVQQLGDELETLVKKHRLQKVVINFENIHYMSSAVMGKLVSLFKQLNAEGGDLRLCRISDSIYEIFKIMRFDKLFKICDTEDDAVIELMK